MSRRARSSRTWSGATASLKVAPKTVNQKRYVDAIRSSTITFGSAPPARQVIPGGCDGGGGAVAARGQPDRADPSGGGGGERLGFLPGDLMAKVDPYLRPLFDALYDMLEPSA